MGGDFKKTQRTHFDGYLRKPTLKSELFDELKKFLSEAQIYTDKYIENIVLNILFPNVAHS